MVTQNNLAVSMNKFVVARALISLAKTYVAT
jgi:hypothetical protein